MKEQYKKMLVCIAILAILFLVASSFFIKNQREDFALTKEIFVNKYDGIAITEKKQLYRIKSVIVQNGNYIVLDENGTVWQWKEGETKEKAKEIANMEDIVQIVDTGYNSIYALTRDGDVYAWGTNIAYMIDPAEDSDVEFSEPVKLKGLSNIINMDAGNGQAFAVNNDGQLFAWGLGRYKDMAEDKIPSLLEGYQELMGDVEEIYMGAGNFHYFKSKGNQFFSIMSEEYILDYLAYFIVPNFPGEPSESNWNEDILTGESERIFDIREEGGYCLAYLYEMGKNDNITIIAADGYTMYIYQNDGTLWYWDSERITYHDCERAGASLELQNLDYRGFFEEVDIENVLSMEADSMVIPKIISISSGKDGALFLMENGQVFESKYVTTEIKDVEYFDSRNPNPDISVQTAIQPNLSMKKLDFQRLDFENIVNISSDKNNNFYLVNKLGNIYCYQIESELKGD